MRARSLLAAALLAAPAIVAFAQDARNPAAADVVRWLDAGATKSRTGVLIESAGYDQVVFAQNGRRTTLDGADVVEIRWGDAPQELDRAWASLRSGDAEAARAGFDQVLRTRATQRGWLVVEGSAGLAESLLALSVRDRSKAERAAHAFGTARDANPRSLLLDRILGGLARAQLLLKKPDAALDAANQLEAAAKTAKRPLWQAEALLLRAQAYEAQGDTAGAVRALTELVEFAPARAATARDSDTKQKLRRFESRAAARSTWLLVADAERARSADATERVTKFADKILAAHPGDAEIEAAVVNSRGALLLAAGDARGALRRFQEVEVLHFDVPEEAARAVHYQARCYDRLADETRRKERQQELEESWIGTEWSRRLP